MMRRGTNPVVAVWLVAMVVLVMGCGDDSAPSLVDQGGTPDQQVAQTDGALSQDGGVAEDGALDGQLIEDQGTPDAEVDDAGSPDAEMDDAGSPDAEVDDAGSPDAEMDDAGSPDAEVDDAGSPDAEVDDAGSPDAEVDDAGSPDAEVDDAALPDTTPGATCDDQAHNGDETDMDCGGPDCGPCDVGQACASGDDCLSRACFNNVCLAPTCFDRVHNGDETDVDCGGPCDPCEDGRGCGEPTDCVSGVCGDDSLCAEPTCDDQVHNGDETDVDCGGGTCGACGDGLACGEPTDCISGVCGDDNVCAAPTCDDQVQNGDETAVDCGGGTCDACAFGQACALCTDCASTHCLNGQCAAPAASCKAILAACPTATDGPYLIDHNGGTSTDAFAVECDMTTDGGGWTRITPSIARNHLGGQLVAVEAAPEAGFDGSDRPYATDRAGYHTYHYTFAFNGGYQEFFLREYHLRARSGGSYLSEINPATFVQSSWSKANDCASMYGDVSFGNPFDAGPLTSYAALLDSVVSCADCTLAWPGGETVYSYGGPSIGFRMGWGECGGQWEGWYPWWSGYIYLR